MLLKRQKAAQNIDKDLKRLKMSFKEKIWNGFEKSYFFNKVPKVFFRSKSLMYCYETNLSNKFTLLFVKIITQYTDLNY